MIILVVAPIVGCIATGTPLSTLPSGGQRNIRKEPEYGIDNLAYLQDLDAMRHQLNKNIEPYIKDMPEEKRKKIHEAFEDMTQALAHIHAECHRVEIDTIVKQK